jgi:hypothetical protein
MPRRRSTILPVQSLKAKDNLGRRSLRATEEAQEGRVDIDDLLHRNL